MTTKFILYPTPPTVAEIEFRPYQGNADHPIIARFDHMGIPILGFSDPPAQLIFAESSAETVGYGRVWLKPREGEQRFFLDLGVEPTWSERGLTKAILTWQEASARGLALARPVQEPHVLLFFVSDSNPGLQQLLEEFGYTVAWTKSLTSGLFAATCRQPSAVAGRAARS